MKFSATARSVQGFECEPPPAPRGSSFPPSSRVAAQLPLNVELDHNEIYHAVRKEAFHSSILTMEVAGGQGEQVLLRSVQ